MPTWTYTAVPLTGAATTPIRGEITGEDPPSIRIQLRRVGLQVLELHEQRPPIWTALDATRLTAPLSKLVAERLRSRRVGAKAEFYDAVATMVAAGLTLLDATASVGESRSKIGALGREMARDLRDGRSLAESMTHRRAWFDQAERAIIQAGEHRGDLAGALRTLSDRQHRSGELSGRLISALAYPAIVTVVGVAVVVFLSTRTLPQITQILIDAEISVPPITAAVMALGQALVASVPWIAALLPVAVVLALSLGRVRRVTVWAGSVRNLITPALVRRAAVGDAITELAQLARVGVSLTEALRVVAETARGFGMAPLRRHLEEAVIAIESGKPISEAFVDPRWFDPELRRLIATGEAAGELPSILERVGDRYRRSARRSIDRLAAILEPAVILILATGIGLVVMAAIQPLIRLQEVL
ncbi:MAG: type II secretion system F family protein [Planctomycetota bacterium]